MNNEQDDFYHIKFPQEAEVATIIIYHYIKHLLVVFIANIFYN